MNEHSSWYRTESSDRGLTVNFVPDADRYWTPDVLSARPLPIESFAGVNVCLTGAGAVWMYAHAAAVATGASAKSVEVQSAAAEGSGIDRANCNVTLEIDEVVDAGRCLVKAQLTPTEPLANSIINDLLKPITQQLLSSKFRDVVLTGRAPIGVYATLAAAAVRGGAIRVACHSPSAGLIAVFSSKRDQKAPPAGASLLLDDWLRERLGRAQPGRIIGVVGDPNVGKSCFSSVLEAHMRNQRLVGWRMDCDGQSPTPPWYLGRRAVGDVDAAESLRNAAKRSWTGSMESELAMRLIRLRESLAITIADLPGGDHRCVPPQRIPPGRERVFAPIDVLVLIQRPDCPSEPGWRDALRSSDLLSSRIVAVINSVEPESPPSLSGSVVDDVWRGTATGLDRTHSAEQLRLGFSPTIASLWQFVTTRLVN